MFCEHDESKVERKSFTSFSDEKCGLVMASIRDEVIKI